MTSKGDFYLIILFQLIDELRVKLDARRIYTKEGSELDYGQAFCYAQYGKNWDKIISQAGMGEPNVETIQIGRKMIENPEEYLCYTKYGCEEEDE